MNKEYDEIKKEFQNHNLAKMKNVKVTVWDSPECNFPRPNFEGTLFKFINWQSDLNFDEMKALDCLRVNDLAFLSSKRKPTKFNVGNGYMVVRRDS